jgi:hypothetical protein
LGKIGGQSFVADHMNPGSSLYNVAIRSMRSSRESIVCFPVLMPMAMEFRKLISYRMLS